MNYLARSCGYYNGTALKDCEKNGIVAYVPPPRRSGRLAAQGRLSHEAFVYDAAADAYRCTGSARLRPSQGRKLNAGRIEIRHASRTADCDACPLRPLPAGLMALCYNVSRVLAIIGLDRLIAAVAGRAGKTILPLLGARVTALDVKQHFRRAFAARSPIIRSTNPSPSFAR